MVIGFVQIESVQDRVWRHAAGNMSTDDILAEGPRPIPKSFHDGGHTPEGRHVYWCAADRPDTSREFVVAPVYRTKVPEDASCEECGISLRELADNLTEALP